MLESPTIPIPRWNFSHFTALIHIYHEPTNHSVKTEEWKIKKFLRFNIKHNKKRTFFGVRFPSVSVYRLIWRSKPKRIKDIRLLRPSVGWTICTFSSLAEDRLSFEQKRLISSALASTVDDCFFLSCLLHFADHYPSMVISGVN